MFGTMPPLCLRFAKRQAASKEHDRRDRVISAAVEGIPRMPLLLCLHSPQTRRSKGIFGPALSLYEAEAAFVLRFSKESPADKQADKLEDLGLALQAQPQRFPSFEDKPDLVAIALLTKCLFGCLEHSGFLLAEQGS